MPKTLTEAALSTPNARLKLPEGNHWRGLNADVHLGYRKQKRGGRWMVRWYLGDQKYKQETIGAADDGKVDADAINCFSFEQAKTRAAVIVNQVRADQKAAAAGPAPTVATAVAAYIATEDAKQTALGLPKRDARIRLTKHVMSSPIAEVALHTLSADDLADWRDGLDSGLASATKRRVVNDFRAALNAAATKHRARLPAEVFVVIKSGFAKEQAETAVARDKAALPDADIRRLMEAAAEVDEEDGWEGDLLRMLLVLSATGSRFSQVRRCLVGDLQLKLSRLMVPTSRKGRGDKRKTHTRASLGADVVEALRPAIAGRRPAEPLLERWRHKQEKGSDGQPPRWVREGRGPWLNASELGRPWAKIVKRAGLPADIVPYALRHSSIVRHLALGIPVRLVADLHDTSSRMIELHYTSSINDVMDEVSAKAIIPLAPTPAAAKVTRLRAG